MKMLDNKGFTLIELMAVIILLSLITAVGVNSMNSVIIRSKEEDYKLLVGNIKDAVEVFYYECKYELNDLNRTFCGNGAPASPKNELTLGELVVGGFITSNGIGTQELKLFDPRNSEDISCCKIKYSYDSGTGKFNITADGIVGTCSEIEFCPTSY